MDQGKIVLLLAPIFKWMDSSVLTIDLIQPYWDTMRKTLSISARLRDAESKSVHVYSPTIYFNPLY